MSLQVDEVGGAVLRAAHRGARRHRAPRRADDAHRDRRPTARSRRWRFADGTELPTDMVVFSAGIRPRDELARSCGPGARRARRHRRSTIAAAPPIPTIFAIGECALYDGRIYGLVAPGYQMARVAAAALARPATDAMTLHRRRHEHQAQADGRRRRQLRRRVRQHAGRARAQRRRHAAPRSTRSWWSAPTASACSAACSSATPPTTASCCSWCRTACRCRRTRRICMLPPRAGERRPAWASTRCPTPRSICSCNNVSKGADLRRHRRRRADRGRRAQDVHQGRHRLRRVRPAGRRDPDQGELRKAGVVVSNRLCEHFAHSRQELFHLVRLHRHPQSFDELLAQPRPRARLRDLQAGGGVDPRVGLERAHPRPQAPAAAGHQRSLPRQHPARRHLLGRAARAGRRDHARQADRARRGRQELRPVHQDHRRPAHRPVRRARRAAAGHLARARRRRLRVGARLRQGAAHGEVAASAAPGAATACRTRSASPIARREPLQGAALRRTSSSRPSRAARASAPRRRARTSASSPPRRARTSTCAATAA